MKGKLGVIYQGKYAFLVCGDCGVSGKLMVALARGDDEKLYLWLVCGTCEKYLTAVDNPERIERLISVANKYKKESSNS